MPLTERFLHSFVIHDYNRISIAHKKVPELKFIGQLQCIVLLLLRDLSKNNSLTKIKRKLQMKIAKPQKLKGRKTKKITQGSRGIPRLL